MQGGPVGQNSRPQSNNKNHGHLDLGMLIAIISSLVTVMVTDQVPIDSKFPLHKNTRFEECAAAVPDTDRCAPRNTWITQISGIRDTVMPLLCMTIAVMLSMLW
ncbi:hypothetical protein BDV12DRAFT_45841 [Aspergillus spectabilis]